MTRKDGLTREDHDARHDAKTKEEGFIVKLAPKIVVVKRKGNHKFYSMNIQKETYLTLLQLKQTLGYSMAELMQMSVKEFVEHLEIEQVHP